MKIRIVVEKKKYIFQNFPRNRNESFASTKTTPPISQSANSAPTIVNNTSLIAIPREKERKK